VLRAPPASIFSEKIAGTGPGSLNMAVAQTFKTWTVCQTLISVVALLPTLATML
jgi:hypothetical protein